MRTLPRSDAFPFKSKRWKGKNITITTAYIYKTPVVMKTKLANISIHPHDCFFFFMNQRRNDSFLGGSEVKVI